MNTLKLDVKPWDKTIVEELHDRGFIQLLQPTEKITGMQDRINLVDDIYCADEAYGPHKLICAGLLTDTVRLGVHPGQEEIILPDLGEDYQPCYYVVCYLSEEDLRRKDQQGELSADDFVCLSMFPTQRGLDIFTVCPGTVHCEVTPVAPGKVPYIFVTEPRDLPITWIDLENHAFEVSA